MGACVHVDVLHACMHACMHASCVRVYVREGGRVYGHTGVRACVFACGRRADCARMCMHASTHEYLHRMSDTDVVKLATAPLHVTILEDGARDDVQYIDNLH